MKARSKADMHTRLQENGCCIGTTAHIGIVFEPCRCTGMQPEWTTTRSVVLQLADCGVV